MVRCRAERASADWRWMGCSDRRRVALEAGGRASARMRRKSTRVANCKAGPRPASGRRASDEELRSRDTAAEGVSTGAQCSLRHRWVKLSADPADRATTHPSVMRWTWSRRCSSIWDGLGDAEDQHREQVVLSRSSAGPACWACSGSGKAMSIRRGLDPLRSFAPAARDIETPLDVVQAAVLHYGFVGVRCTRRWAGGPAATSRAEVSTAAMLRTRSNRGRPRRWCAAEQVPITAHCANSNHATGFDGFGGPDDWYPCCADTRSARQPGPSAAHRPRARRRLAVADRGQSRAAGRTPTSAITGSTIRRSPRPLGWSSGCSLLRRLTCWPSGSCTARTGHGRDPSRVRTLPAPTGTCRPVGPERPRDPGGNALSPRVDDPSNKNAQRLLARYGASPPTGSRPGSPNQVPRPPREDHVHHPEVHHQACRPGDARAGMVNVVTQKRGAESRSRSGMGTGRRGGDAPPPEGLSGGCRGLQSGAATARVGAAHRCGCDLADQRTRSGSWCWCTWCLRRQGEVVEVLERGEEHARAGRSAPRAGRRRRSAAWCCPGRRCNARPTHTVCGRRA